MGGGLYTPKWTSTTYTLLLLRRLGLEHGNDAAVEGCRRLLDDARWVDDGVSYWKTHDYGEICVNAMVLSVCAAFGVDDSRVDGIASMLIRSRLGDGGWNCETPRGASHSSFHTTISVLEALEIWGRVRGTTDAEDALRAGREFMLAHRLFRSHRTGDVIDQSWLRPHFPPRWHYDVLRGLDHFRASGAARDPRLGDAIGILEASRRRDGRWSVGARYTGSVFFRLEPGREGSRVNTMRALRVLRWWEGDES